MNRVILIGRLVADPELRYTQSGIPVARIRLAVDRRYKSASGERETDFINIVAWRRLAELLNEYMKKGRQIAVEGSLQMNRFQTKEGENRVTYEVLAENIQFLDRGGAPGDTGSTDSFAGPSDADAPPDFSSYDNSPDANSELPF